MSLLLPTTRHATIQTVTAVRIHEQEFVDLSFTLEDEPETLRTARLGSADVEGPVEPGCEVRIRFVMGVATSVKRAG
jgi:hypothetical protein